MMDNGEISATVVAEMCLSWMSEDDVKEMMLANDILDDEDEDDYDYDLEAGEDFAQGADQ
jgi:hypothetical protein